MSLRIVFMGTPAFAAPTLAALARDGHHIAAVYTRAPKPGGRRGLSLVKSPVHQQAELLGFPVRTPKSLRAEEEQEAFRALKADVAVVVAYGLILPAPILQAPRLGCYNGHASLLPRWRGAAPIQRAIMAGDAETGMMVMKMDEGLDTGPVALTKRVPIGSAITAGDLHDVLMLEGATLIAEAMRRLERRDLPLQPQADEGATYAAKIEKAETRIDFGRPVRAVHDHIRGLSPFPGAWFEVGGNGERVKVLASEPAGGRGQPGTLLDDRLTIACGDGALRLLKVQKAGGRPLAAAEFLRGNPLPAGATVG
ncbi:MAG: methionyl-tRNA formyltransferase [Pararhizobium sp.]